MRKIFIPAYADGSNVNALSLTAKEIASRLDPERFHVTMYLEGEADARLKTRRNTSFIRWGRHGNTLRVIARWAWSIPDIYCFPNWGHLDAAFIAARKRLRLKTALVSYSVIAMREGDPADRSTLAHRVCTDSILEADCVLGNSGFVAETVHRYYGVPAQTMHDGVDKRYFYPSTPGGVTSEKAGRPVVLYAGSFQKRKRPDVFVRAAARHPEADFRMAGAGEEAGPCRELAAGLGCGNLTFLGMRTLRELGDEMRAADVFLFPSVYEGHPQVLIEAAACGLPCIAMDCYKPDSVVDGRTGYLAADDDELEARLSLLLGDRTLRESFSRASVEHARRFDWEVIVPRWQDVFDEAVRRRLGRLGGSAAGRAA